MKKKEIFKYAGFCFALLVLMVPEVGAQWDDGMEVLNSNIEIGTTPRHESYPYVDYNPTDNEFLVLYRTSGKLRDDCEEGDAYECITSFHSIDGRRVSPDGQLLGGPIQLSPPEEGWKTLPRFAHNVFTNEYMVTFTIGPEFHGGEPYVTRIDSIGNLKYEPIRLCEAMYNISHPAIAFNFIEQEYLVVYNEKDFFSDTLDNFCFVLDKDGNMLGGPFLIGSVEGDQWSPSATYNSTDNTYLVAWEDFRHVADWMEPGDIYGALLDADGNMIVEIPIIDDYGMPNEGNQRSPGIAHNPDRNEFLVTWRDDRPTIDQGAVFGKILNGDGGLIGEEMIICEGPKSQGSPELEYVSEKGKYFLVWTDSRYDPQPPGTDWWFLDGDIFARWLGSNGEPIGDEIPIIIAEGSQMSAEVAYNPGMDRFLIVWRDRVAAYDYDVIPGGGGMAMETAGDVRGTIYGVPESTTSTTSVAPTTTTTTTAVQNPCAALKIYGEHSEEVDLLRYVRDNVLDNTAEGRELIKLYYQLSPMIVKAMEKDEEFKEGVKEMIDGVLGLVGRAE